MGKPLRKKPLGRSKTRWDDKIKTNLKKRGWIPGCTISALLKLALDYHTPIWEEVMRNITYFIAKCETHYCDEEAKEELKLA
jgi:hypothetical protein